MKTMQLYSIRIAKPIDNNKLFYVADMNLSFVVNKFYENYPDAEIDKVVYEGEIYV